MRSPNRSCSCLSDDALTLVTTGGFDWVIGDHEVATSGTSEGVLGIGAATDDGVDEIIERARRAGATVATEPAPQPWGYAAAVADPDGHVWLVTSATLPG
jgi:uncharacterized protein